MATLHEAMRAYEDVRAALFERLDASRCDGTGKPLYVDECSEDEMRMLAAWRQSRYCRIIHGPGRAWWCATALGRVQLTEGE